MNNVLVAYSHVSDGNMLDPNDKNDPVVAHHRDVFLNSLGVTMQQSTRLDILYEGNDYRRYRELSAGDCGKGMFDDDVQSADAIVTHDKNHALFLPLADCVGMVVYDQAQSILMLSHVGRHSLEQDGAYASIIYLIESFGSHVNNLHIWLTPAPGKERYPLWAFDGRDFKEVVFEQLDRAGILPSNITNDPADSTTDLSYFSHSEFLAGRRSDDGRYAVVAMMR